jgi:hypothetical protein
MAKWPGSALIAPKLETERTDYPGKGTNIPWFVRLEVLPGSAAFSVDMDELLQGDAGPSLRALPLFSGVNMLKLEPQEAGTIANALLRKRGEPEAPLRGGTWQPRRNIVHVDTAALVAANVKTPTRGPSAGVTRFDSEYVLQGWLVDHIARRDPAVEGLFGSWDYVTNQEPASPFKPREYMDKIDVFGWESRRFTPDLPPVITTYKVMEVKGVGLTGTDGVQCVEQVLKYVDWVASTRAGGEYDAVDAYLIAPSFDDGVLRFAQRRGRRRYIVPRRPFRSAVWSKLCLVEAKPTQAGVSLHVIR